MRFAEAALGRMHNARIALAVAWEAEDAYLVAVAQDELE